MYSLPSRSDTDGCPDHLAPALHRALPMGKIQFPTLLSTYLLSRSSAVPRIPLMHREPMGLKKPLRRLPPPLPSVHSCHTDIYSEACPVQTVKFLHSPPHIQIFQYSLHRMR